MKHQPERYHGIAIGFHWLIAVLILGMLAIGNYMVYLDESEPLRYLLTQWHKSFGIVAMLLIAFRLLWRLTHSPPEPPTHLQRWEIRAAEMVHVLLYWLIILIPLSGWIMVSASPLEIPTLIFNGFSWPHLTPFDTLSNKAEVSELFGEIHALATWILIGMLVAHIGAALRHQYLLRDGVMQRMSPKQADGRWATAVIPLTSTVIFAIAALIAFGYSGAKPVPLAAGGSKVDFTFVLQGQTTEGNFPESKVELLLDTENSTASSLNATINTTTVSTGNGQIDSTLSGSDWFDVKNYPQASFVSQKLEAAGENEYLVSGVLRIKDISRDLAFPMSLVLEDNKRVARGGFSVNRLDFGLGRESQADEGTVGFQVEVRFEFEVK